jgi:hypothetical protein
MKILLSKSEYFSISNVVHRLENSEPEPGEPRLEKLRA